MNLTDEQKAIGKDNARRVVGQMIDSGETRRDFLKEVTLAGSVAAGGFGAAYWGYGKALDDRLRIGIIGTGDEGNVLIGALNPDVVEVKAISDIRPYSIHRAFNGDCYSSSSLEARPGLCKVFGYADETVARKDIKVYKDSYQDLLDDDDIEAVIIATPLWMHHPIAVAAMRAGKHVLTEKLMGWDVAQCKEMARVAEETGLLLATGHQRHYSVLYDQAVDTVRRGLIGDIHSIRAQWHRGNLPGKDSWTPPLPIADSANNVKDMIRAARKASSAVGSRTEADIKSIYKLVLEVDSWEQVLAGKHRSYGKLKPAESELWAKKVAQKRAQLEDATVDAAMYGYQAGELPGGYQRSALEELIRWRIWDRTGGGLMAELGSHQLDAAGIFISSQFPGKTKVRPLSVTAVGGRYIFPHDRDCDDHVYATYEYPAKGYFEDNDPTTEKVADAEKKCGVVYSSINGNGFGGYGEVVLGTAGTLILEREKDLMLYAGSKTNTKVGYDASKDALVDSYETGGGYTPAAEAVTQDVSRGYKEEIEHWANCIRDGAPATELHCHPKVALADAVIALTTNIAIAKQQRIDFKPEWFDPKSDEVPGGRTPRKASEVKTNAVNEGVA